MDSVDLGRSAPVSFRSPQSLNNSSDKGFRVSSGGKGPNDWEEEIVAPETAWSAARHADATYSPRLSQWASAQRYIDYSSPCQVRTTLKALADATWVLSNSPATPQIGTFIKDWSESTANSYSPQFGLERTKMQYAFGAKSNVMHANPLSGGKENSIPDLDFFQDPATSPVSTICSRSSKGSFSGRMDGHQNKGRSGGLKNMRKAPMKNDMSSNRASLLNSHIGRGL